MAVSPAPEDHVFYTKEVDFTDIFQGCDLFNNMLRQFGQIDRDQDFFSHEDSPKI
jgi:hypothetical protein